MFFGVWVQNKDNQIGASILNTPVRLLLVRIPDSQWWVTGVMFLSGIHVLLLYELVITGYNIATWLKWLILSQDKVFRKIKSVEPGLKMTVVEILIRLTP